MMIPHRTEAFKLEKKKKLRTWIRQARNSTHEADVSAPHYAAAIQKQSLLLKKQNVHTLNAANVRAKTLGRSLTRTFSGRVSRREE